MSFIMNVNWMLEMIIFRNDIIVYFILQFDGNIDSVPVLDTAQHI